MRKLLLAAVSSLMFCSMPQAYAGGNDATARKMGEIYVVLNMAHRCTQLYATFDDTELDLVRKLADKKILALAASLDMPNDQKIKLNDWLVKLTIANYADLELPPKVCATVYSTLFQ